MTSKVPSLDFDVQSAWLRRFTADAESNLRAFALLVKEGIPGKVTIHEKRGLLSRTAKTTGVSIQLGDHQYELRVADGAVHTSIAMIVRGITLNTKQVDPAEWFTRLFQEIQNASVHAEHLSQSLATFMGGGS